VVIEKFEKRKNVYAGSREQITAPDPWVIRASRLF